MSQLTSLYYICHINNLKSILERGILSRSRVGAAGAEKKLRRKFGFFSRNKTESGDGTRTDIHDPDVLRRRDKPLPSKTNLLDCVNLYFQPRNAMLYQVLQNFNAGEIVVLLINASVIDQPGCYVSDRNAATHAPKFLPAKEYKSIIDFGVFKKDYWTDSDDTKQKMMAEILVPDRISPEEIIGVYVSKSNDKVKRMIGPNRSFAVEPHIFFQPTRQWKISENISLSEGDMFFSNMQTFTISVNTKGVMGKGLASRAKYQFPDAYVRYQDDCRARRLRVGNPTLFKRGIRIEEELADDASQLNPEKTNGARWFLFFPTKRHWREDSRIDDIRQSLEWLVNNYAKEGIESIALPALGCGLGNLHWKDVGPLMCRYLNQMKIKSCIYLPMNNGLDDKYMTAEYLMK